VAVDRDCRPRWGWTKPLTRFQDESGRKVEIYRPTAIGPFATTHVFTTLDGKLGLIDWGSRFSSNSPALQAVILRFK